MASDAPFDPFNQSFTLLDLEQSPHKIGISELDDLILYQVQSSINFAAQLGGSLVLLIALLLLAKPEKRSSPIFILNALSLSINFILTLLHCLFFTGPFTQITAILLHDYSRVPRSEYVKQVTTTNLSFVLLICAETSLILQVRVVCVTLRRIHRQVLSVFSVLVVLIALGFRLVLSIKNSIYILSLGYTGDLDWLQSASDITTTISVCWFCSVFVGKLAFALNERRKLGIRNFGPMQVIFIMGIQTFIVPGETSYKKIFERVWQIIITDDQFSNLLALPIFLLTSQHAFQRSHGRRYFPSTLLSLGCRRRHYPLPTSTPALTLVQCRWTSTKAIWWHRFWYGPFSGSR